MDDLAKKVKWKEFYENVIRDRQFCNTSCIVYTRCPLSIQSRISDKHKCRVRELDSDHRRHFVRMFVFGEEGLYDEALAIIFNLTQILDLQNDKKDITLFLEALIKVARTFKGVAPDNSPKKLTINLEDYAPENKVMLVGQNGVVEEGKIVLDHDEESLIESPNLDSILKGPPKGKMFT